MVPIKDIRNLYVTFPIPDLQKYYKSNPGHYLGHLIGHEGPGSLLSELKAKGKVCSELTLKPWGNCFPTAQPLKSRSEVNKIQVAVVIFQTIPHYITDALFGFSYQWLSTSYMKDYKGSHLYAVYPLSPVFHQQDHCL